MRQYNIPTEPLLSRLAYCKVGDIVRIKALTTKDDYHEHWDKSDDVGRALKTLEYRIQWVRSEDEEVLLQPYRGDEELLARDYGHTLRLDTIVEVLGNVNDDN